jgi:hypothetical protein
MGLEVLVCKKPDSVEALPRVVRSEVRVLGGLSVNEDLVVDGVLSAHKDRVEMVLIGKRGFEEEAACVGLRKHEGLRNVLFA